MISSSSYSVPPVPAGWAIGVVFTDVGAALALSGAIVVKLFKVRQRLWTVVGILGLCIVGLGVRNIILSPLELPACPCLPGYYGSTCLPCPPCGIHSEGCNDGSEGNGECPCDMGWGGVTCSVCAETFAGTECDECKRGWDGLECDRCYPGYTGVNCDRCDVGWVPESDDNGVLCRTCEPGRFGGYCKLCPDCTEHDTLAVCKDNAYHEANTYLSLIHI